MPATGSQGHPARQRVDMRAGHLLNAAQMLVSFLPGRRPSHGMRACGCGKAPDWRSAAF